MLRFSIAFPPERYRQPTDHLRFASVTDLFTDRARLRGLSRVQAQYSKTPRVARQAPPGQPAYFFAEVFAELRRNWREIPDYCRRLVHNRLTEVCTKIGFDAA